MKASPPFKSKVIRDNKRHITRADYQNTAVSLSSENIIFPKKTSMEARVLYRLFDTTLSHRGFDDIAHSYRLGAFIDNLRDKGWTIVNHDEICLTKDFVPRKAKFTRYELYAVFTAELLQRIKHFCKAVDDFEATATASSIRNNQKAPAHSNIKAAE